MPAESQPKRAAIKGARTRRRLLDAAAAELAAVGPANASLAGVAERAGIKSGSIYFHFESRDALFRAVLETGLGESIDRINAAVTESAEPAKQIRTLIGVHIDLMTELSDYTTVALAMADQFDTDTTREFRSLQRQYTTTWTTAIQRAKDTGVLPGDTPAELLAELVLGALNAVRKRARRSPETVVSAMEVLLGISQHSEHN